MRKCDGLNDVKSTNRVIKDEFVFREMPPFSRSSIMEKYKFLVAYKKKNI